MSFHSFYRLYRSHLKATVNLAWPIIIGQLGQILMNVVDVMMVGRMDDIVLAAASVAAAGVSTSVFFLVGVFGMGLSTAVPALVSIAKAKKDKHETAGILRGAYVVASSAGLLIQLLVLTMAFNFHWFSQPEAVESLAKNYLKIISFSAIPMILFLCVKQFAEALSQTIPAMLVTLVAVVFNAFINWVLIYGNLGFPSLGLEGAGYATLLTRLAMATAILLYIYRSKKLKEYILNKPKKVWGHVRKIIRVGIPSGFQYFFEIAAFSMASIMAGWISINQSAAHQIAISLASISYMCVTGFAAAGSIRVAGGFGNNNFSEMRRAGNSALYMGIAFMCLSGLALFFFRFPLAELYVENPDVINMVTGLLIIAALFQISDGIQAISLGILRGITDVKIPTLVTLTAYWFLAMPVCYLLGFTFNMGVTGIWIGLLIGLTGSAAFNTWRFYHLTGKLK